MADIGLLEQQGMRAARIVLDIGLYLGLRIPAGEPTHPGERWRPEFVLPFLRQRCFFPSGMLASEIDRYLGWPGQAISYKVGERAWLAARAAFDLQDFHATALAMGPMSLDQLQRELGSPTGAPRA